MTTTTFSIRKPLFLSLAIIALFSFNTASATTEETTCFELVFPVNYVYVDGTVIKIETKAALTKNQTEWAADGYTEHVHIAFPIQIKWGNDAAKTINTRAEMKAEKANCN